jgi:hypothetical protein
MKILLFDMDGVLLESRGYHLALQETVRRMALSLGFGEATLAPDDIAAFEAGGITCEWDEAAISTALMLENAWQDDPDLRPPGSLAAPAPSRSTPRPVPDFQALALALSESNLFPLLPLERAERLFLDLYRLSPPQADLLRELFRTARDPHRSLTHRTFQELVLGSDDFSETYGMPACLATESYLLKYDRPLLSLENSARLKDWIAVSGHAAAVLTSRPSRPPAGVFGTPEAELGAALVGLEGIPIAGWGGLCWLGLQRQADPQTFLKPSAVQALAALRQALGEPQESALSAAAELVATGKADRGWDQFGGAEVSVFEDTSGGINSLRRAREVLDAAGIHLVCTYFGIGQNPLKVRSLRDCGAQVFPSLAEALALVVQSG